MLVVRAATFACSLAFALTLAHSAQAQSFNCRYAKSPDEVAICQSDRLSRLDQILARLYFSVRNRLYGGERAALEREQARWLRSRRDCGADIPCIAESYESRIQELREY